MCVGGSVVTGQAEGWRMHLASLRRQAGDAPSESLPINQGENKTDSQAEEKGKGVNVELEQGKEEVGKVVTGGRAPGPLHRARSRRDPGNLCPAPQWMSQINNSALP